MSKLFIDTSAFYALEDYSDKFHLPAITFWEEKAKECSLFTSNYVYVETLLLLKSRLSQYKAERFGKLIQSSKRLEILRITEFDDREAWKIFTKYSDQGFSYVDCTSFFLMKKFSIKNAFTIDSHFRQMSFLIHPGK